MQIKRHTSAGLVVTGILTLAVSAAGCGGGSSTKATPLGTSTTVGPTSTGGATRAARHPSSAASPTPTRTGTGPVTTAAAPAPQPSAAEVAAAEQDLDQAGSSLAGSDSAINGSDVNQAEAQEGSAP